MAPCNALSPNWCKSMAAAAIESIDRPSPTLDEGIITMTKLEACSTYLASRNYRPEHSARPEEDA